MDSSNAMDVSGFYSAQYQEDPFCCSDSIESEQFTAFPFSFTKFWLLYPELSYLVLMYNYI